MDIEPIPQVVNPGDIPGDTLEAMIYQVMLLNRAKGWIDQERSFSEDMALLHSEVSEAFEANRKGHDDEIAEELADVLIRLLDTCYRYDIILGEAYVQKMKKNWDRPFRHGGRKL